MEGFWTCFHMQINLYLSAERADYVIEPIKSRDVHENFYVVALLQCALISRQHYMMSLLADVAALLTMVFSFNFANVNNKVIIYLTRSKLLKSGTVVKLRSH